MFVVLYMHYHTYVKKAELIRRVYGLEKKWKFSDMFGTRNKVLDEKSGINYDLKKDRVRVPTYYTDGAWTQIEKSLDVVHLTREITSLRFLLVSLCNEQTRLLLPTVMCLATSQIKNYDNQDGLNFSSEL